MQYNSCKSLLIRFVKQRTINFLQNPILSVCFLVKQHIYTYDCDKVYKNVLQPLMQVVFYYYSNHMVVYLT